MTVETRGQNSWVNFGPHGEHNRANPAETKYAEQKATVIPDKFLRVEREDGTQFSPLKDDEEFKPRGVKQAKSYKEIKKFLTPEELSTVDKKTAKEAVRSTRSSRRSRSSRVPPTWARPSVAGTRRPPRRSTRCSGTTCPGSSSCWPPPARDSG
jgi:hypothetical protein